MSTPIDGAYSLWVDEWEDAEDCERDYLTAWLRTDYERMTADQCREMARQLLAAAELLDQRTNERRKA